jgi:purine-nucleoside phosphorylase
LIPRRSDWTASFSFFVSPPSFLRRAFYGMVGSAKDADLREESLVRTKPFRDFRKKKVLYIPADLPDRFLQIHLKTNATKAKPTLFGEFYLFNESVVLYQAMGAPLAVLALEGLIAGGAQEIIVLGFSGSLAPQFSIGDTAIISRAWSEEGTSPHYFPGKSVFSPSPGMKRRVEGTLDSLGLPYREAELVSMDAPCRETPSWLKKQTAKGIGLVDMETSAVFALAEFHGVESAALMIVSDELRPDSWKDGFSRKDLRERVKEYFFPFI